MHSFINEIIINKLKNGIIEKLDDCAIIENTKKSLLAPSPYQGKVKISLDPNYMDGYEEAVLQLYYMRDETIEERIERETFDKEKGERKLKQTKEEWERKLKQTKEEWERLNKLFGPDGTICPIK